MAGSECEGERGGRHGAAVQDQRGRHHGQPEEEIHGRLHLCILTHLYHVLIFINPDYESEIC